MGFFITWMDECTNIVLINFQRSLYATYHAAQALSFAFNHKGQGHIVAFDRFFSCVPLIDRLNGIGVNAVGTINKSKADQPILFESDLKKENLVGRIGGKGRMANQLRSYYERDQLSKKW